MKPWLALLLLLVWPAAGAVAQDDPVALSLPIACEPGRSCFVQSYVDHDPGPGAKDYRCGSRTYDAHSGVDIRIQSLKAMRDGVAVMAAAAGKVTATRDSVEDLSIRDRVGGTNFQDCGNAAIIDHGGGWVTEYCHMRLGSVRVAKGDVVQVGQVIGLVGLSGNTEFPHLHVTVFKDRKVVDPFAYGEAPGACSGGVSLWTPGTAAKLAYRQREVLNTGFAAGAVDEKAVEGGEIPAPMRQGGFLVAYVRAIGLKSGDMVGLTITGPDGATVIDAPPSVLTNDQAQRLTFAGKRAPPAGWKPGRYKAAYTVRSGGMVVLTRSFELAL